MVGSTVLFAFFITASPWHGVCTLTTAGLQRSPRFAAPEERTQQDPPRPDHYAALREQLRQPGREGEPERRSAIVRLLSMPEAAAHQLVQEHLAGVAGDRLFVVVELAKHLANADDRVFGVGAREPAIRRQLLESYVEPLARCWVLSLDADKLPPAERPALQDGLRSALRLLPLRERESGFTAMLASRNLGLREAALRVIPECASLNLAPMLAALFDDADLGALARESLFTLTLQRFASKQEFDAWFTTAPSTYADLTERAARESQQAMAALRTESERRCQQLQIELIEALVVSSQQVEWKRVQRHLGLESGVPFVEGLAKLRTLLADKKDYTASGADTDRLALLEAMVGRYDEISKKGNGVVERALLIETSAYLVKATETDRRDAMQARLMIALEEAEPRLRIAAVCGLSRYPGRESMQKLLAVGRHASGGTPDEALLGACLQTLASWDAPSEEAVQNEWVGLIEQVVLDPRLSIETTRRTAMLRVLDKRDAGGVRPPKAFLLLDRLVADASLEPTLRRLALSQMQVFAGDEQLGEQVRERLRTSLMDESDIVRGAAATFLQRLPDTDLAKLGPLLAMAQTTLRNEKSEVVLKALVESLKALGQRFPHQMIEKLTAVIDTPEGEDRLSPRRALIVDALKVLAMNDEREPKSWVLAARSLRRLGDRDALRQILARQFASLKKPGVDPETIRQGMQLVIDAARLKPPELSWGSDALIAEARDVVSAIADMYGKAVADPETAILQVEVLIATGQQAQAVAKIDGLDNSLLPEPLRKRLQVAAGEAYLRLGKPLDAARFIGPGRGNGSGTPPSALFLRLQQELAAALLAEKPRDAVALLEHVLQNTADALPEHLSRTLLLADALLKADAANGSAVRQLLETKRPLFGERGTPEQKATLEELLKQAAGQDA